LAAISARGGLYVKAARSAIAAGFTSVDYIAQAIANAGYCTTDVNCFFNRYGATVQADYNQLVPVVECLFPWLTFTPGIFQ
jgi:hypothetical protein